MRHIQRIKSQIAAGTYETPEKLDVAADAMLDEVIPLSTRREWDMGYAAGVSAKRGDIGFIAPVCPAEVDDFENWNNGVIAGLRANPNRRHGRHERRPADPPVRVPNESVAMKEMGKALGDEEE